jgi:hypothetical protein
VISFGEPNNVATFLTGAAAEHAFLAVDAEAGIMIVVEGAERDVLDALLFRLDAALDADVDDGVSSVTTDPCS